MLSKSLQDVGKELKLPNPFHKMRKLIPGPKYDSKNKEKDRSTFLMNIYVIKISKELNKKIGESWMVFMSYILVTPKWKESRMKSIRVI